MFISKITRAEWTPQRGVPTLPLVKLLIRRQLRCLILLVRKKKEAIISDPGSSSVMSSNVETSLTIHERRRGTAEIMRDFSASIEMTGDGRR